MDQHLYKYFVLHSNLSLPQVGSLTMARHPAKFNPQAGLLQAPVTTIHFSDGAVPMSEKLFFDFLTAETGGDEVGAICQFHDYMHRLRADLNEKYEASIPGLGTLQKDEAGRISFMPLHDASALTPGVSYAQNGYSAVTDTDETVEAEEIRERWWIGALILAALGAAALLVYYNS